jgi:acetyltransferase-like isoleucine patch superfamily enzyme
MIGTGAVVTRDVEPYHIALGIPAKTIKVKMDLTAGNTVSSD